MSSITTPEGRKRAQISVRFCNTEILKLQQCIGWIQGQERSCHGFRRFHRSGRFPSGNSETRCGRTEQAGKSLRSVFTPQSHWRSPTWFPAKLDQKAVLFAQWKFPSCVRQCHCRSELSGYIRSYIPSWRRSIVGGSDHRHSHAMS